MNKGVLMLKMGLDNFIRSKLSTLCLRFSLLVLALASFNVFGQDRTITGKVTSDDGTALPGVNVLLKGTSTGVVTDSEGTYKITVNSTGRFLVFSFIGFKTQEVEVGNRNTIDILMISDATQLTEIVVTSFGIEREKQSLGFGIQTVNADQLTATRQPNIINALQGQIAGVQITSSGGAPGMSSRILIRGITSLNPGADNQPLFIIDGVPIDNSTNESGGTPRGLSNRALDINPNDIESINVLKGAAATGLYGVRAANGAIVITTKQGKSGSVTINAGATLGTESINKFPNFQKRYGQGFGGLYDLNSVFPAWGAPIDAGRIVDPDYHYYDNYRNVMQTGTMRDTYVNVSGGNDLATFYTSVNNTYQEGVVPFADWGRTSARFRGSIKFNEKFNISASLNYSVSGGDRVPHDRIGETLMYWPHTMDATKYIKPDGSQIAGPLSDNPLYNARFWTYTDKVDRTITNINANYKILPWIELSYRFGSDFYIDKREEILPGPLGVDNEEPLSATGFIEQRRILNRWLNSNFYVTVTRDITNDIKGVLRLGNEVLEQNYNSIRTTGSEFVTPRFYHFNNVRNFNIEEYTSQRRLVGFYGDISLNYKDYLYLNITGRNDLSSTLPKQNNSFFYPSVNLSFVFNDVLNLPQQLSYGKFRAAYGEVGKDTDPYRTTTTYTAASGFPINNQLGYTRSTQLGSPNLKPEKTTTIEFGTELKFLDNRLGLDLTWYKANSKDQILAVPISNAAGYTTAVTNAGEIENKGIELVLTGTPIRNSDFQWDVQLNYTKNKNTVVDIAEGIEEIVVSSQFGYVGSSVTMKLIENAPYGNLYGSSYQRYYSGGEPSNLRYLDKDRDILIGANGFPVLNFNQLVIGNIMPDWVLGLRNNFTYKNISLSVLVDGRFGVDQYDQFGNFMSAFGKLDYSNDRNHIVIFDGVLSDGSPNTKEVWMGQNLGPDGVNYGAGFYRNYHRRVSENFVKDASFIKLRNVTLSYNLPNAWLSPLSIKRAYVSATVNNIILWTPWRNYDPESYSSGAGSNATGFTGLGYPGTKSMLFSINVTL
jgi:TonB-linked SusC/RagA family outer membrane protein